MPRSQAHDPIVDFREPIQPSSRSYGGATRVVVTAKQAADPAAWRVCGDDACTSILAELSDAAHRSYPLDVDGATRYRPPVLTTRPDGACTFGIPDVRIGVMVPVDGVFCSQEFVVDVHLDDRHRITAVGLRERVPA